EICGGLQGGAERAAGKIAVRELAFVAARLVDECGGHCGHSRSIQIVPGSPAQALRDEQVAFAVDAPEDAPVRADTHLAVLVPGQVVEFEQHVGDSVENLGHGTGATANLSAQVILLLLELSPAFRPAGVGFAFRARMAGVLLHALAKPGELSLATITFRPRLQVVAI